MMTSFPVHLPVSRMEPLTSSEVRATLHEEDTETQKTIMIVMMTEINDKRGSSKTTTSSWKGSGEDDRRRKRESDNETNQSQKGLPAQ